MDPQTAWDQLLATYAEGDWDQIEEHAEALLAWLDRGGFPPRIVSRTDLPEWDRTLAQAGCQLAIEAIRERWHIPCNDQQL